MKIYSDQEIMLYLDQAPQLIQIKITSRDTIGVIVAIGKSKGLHIDQVGKIAELNRNTLLGLVTPQEFLDELIAIGIPEKDAREIMTEINQKIFVPLRQEEEKNGIAASSEPVRGTIEGVRPVPPPSSTVVNHAPSTAPLRPYVASGVGGSRFFHLENKIPSSPHSAPLPPKTVLPRSWESRTLPTSPSSKLLEDHEEPHIEFKPTAPPLNLPGAMPEVPAPIAPPKTEFRLPLHIAMSKPAPIPSNKSYAMDPYREPVDDHISEI